MLIPYRVSISPHNNFILITQRGQKKQKKINQSYNLLWAANSEGGFHINLQVTMEALLLCTLLPAASALLLQFLHVCFQNHQQFPRRSLYRSDQA